jgi:hypothetical protein
MTPEGKIKKKLVEVLKRENIWHYFPANNGMGRGGIPDVVAIVGGTFVGIECKADKSKEPTALQIQCGKQIRAAGGYWFLVYDDETISQVQKWINRWMNR